MDTKRALPRVLCIVGPTTSGKTMLGVSLAKRFKGEVINADARQVFQRFDVGTGKPTGGKRITRGGISYYSFENVPHYLMDFLAPDKTFTVADWRDAALTAIAGITRRKHLPIIVGGTGLYVQTLVDNYKIPEVSPQPQFRAAMSTKPLSELVDMLIRLDPKAKTLIDLRNPRRVLRALEVITFTGKPFTELRKKSAPIINPLLIGYKRTREELRQRINDAVETYIESGWLDEIRRVREEGISWDAPAMTSIGYRELGAYLRGESTLQEAIAKTKDATWQYAKRQLTWFKRDKRIHWVESEEEAAKLVQDWYET